MRKFEVQIAGVRSANYATSNTLTRNFFDNSR